jgi:hypothetical protein
MLVYVRYGRLVEVRDLPLGEPDGLAVEADVKVD